MKTNRLPESTSPYLQQHAHQAVAWQPWDAATFTAATRDNSLLFISIGYSACHWCHVMSHDSFDHLEVAAALNANFVAVKVDREEHPDVDRFYMEAVLAMQGQGGWPLTVIATPDGTPIWGGTFVWRAQLLRLLGQIAQAWRDDAPSVQELGARVLDALRAGPRRAAPDGASAPAGARDATLRVLRERFDPVHGGFGGAPKFPSSAALMLLARRYAQTRDPDLLPLLTRTCDAMLRGGIYDHVGGGFHRYATDHAWHVPHFEKMLYDNALLAIAYADAAAVTRASQYTWAVQDILWYVQRDLQHPDGPFYTAEDADSGGIEGAFYAWTLAETEATLPALQATQAKYWWQLTTCGNWEERKNVLHLRGDVPWETLDSAAYYDVRTALFAARNTRARPQRDDKVLVGHNGLMLVALARAAQLTGDVQYLAVAQRAAYWLLQHAVAPDGALARSWCRGVTQWGACAPDYAYLIWGLLELASAAGDAQWLTLAAQLCTQADRTLWSVADAGYYYAPHDPQLPLRDCEWDDGALPGSNAIMALNLTRLGLLRGDAQQVQRGLALAQRAVVQTAAHPMAGATAQWVAADTLLEPLLIVIVGAADNPQRAALLTAARQRYRPGMLIVAGAPGTFPIVTQKGTVRGHATAHVCRGATCLPSVTTAAALQALLENPL